MITQAEYDGIYAEQDRRRLQRIEQRLQEIHAAFWTRDEDTRSMQAQTPFGLMRVFVDELHPQDRVSLYNAHGTLVGVILNVQNPK